MRIAHDLKDALETARAGLDCMCPCSAHDDSTASLHVTPGTEQDAVLFCHAGCTTAEVLAAEGLTFADISKPQEERDREDRWTPQGPYSHAYHYRDEAGHSLFQVLRIPLPNGKKSFRQRHRSPDDGRWVWNMEGVRRVLYRLPEILAAKERGETIYVVEGEKDADNLVARGFAATTSPMGAGKWQEEYGHMLAGADVVIIADADNVGRAHARHIRDDLKGQDCTVRLAECPRPFKDVSDLLDAGGSLDDLVWTSPDEKEARLSYGVDILDVIIRTVSPTEFLIPNVLAKGDRVMFTGLEGHGKSVLMRQFAACVAAGIHPWDETEIEPKRVLFIDAENHPNQVLSSWTELAGKCAARGRPIERDQLVILEEWDSEPDLISIDGSAWLEERIYGYMPDLVCMGPLYNLVGRDLKDDETVRRLKRVINMSRSICGSAYVMEHHAPHKGPMDKKRSVRPYGSSILLRWPEFGYGLSPMEQEGVYEMEKVRMPRIRTRDWPTHLRWGRENSAEFPWVKTELDDETGLPLY